MTRSIRVSLDRETASAAIGRACVANLIGGASTIEQYDDAVLVVSELVTNAVLHGREPLALEVEVGTDTVCVQVFDADSAVERIADARLTERREPGGRGLVIVDALANRWGADVVAGGKRVWATLAISG